MSLTRFLACFALLFVAAGEAQVNPFDAYFSATKSTSLSAAAEVVSVQHTATALKSARFVSIYAYCSVACTITLERGANSTAGTAITPVNLNPANTFATTTNCTATSGTTITSTVVVNVYNLAAGGFISLDGSLFQFSAGTADSLTLRTSSITGNVVLQEVWREL